MYTSYFAMNSVISASSASSVVSDSPDRLTPTVWWILSMATVGLVFDGYDLVVYGAVVSTFLRDASQIGPITPAVAGALGSQALFGAPALVVWAALAGPCWAACWSPRVCHWITFFICWSGLRCSILP